MPGNNNINRYHCILYTQNNHQQYDQRFHQMPTVCHQRLMKNRQNLTPVCLLSDDEQEVQTQVVPRVPVQKRRVSTGFIKQKSLKKGFSSPLNLRRLVQSHCGCFGACFHPFNKNIALFDEVLKIRKLLDAMTKLEQDAHVPHHHEDFP